MLLFLKRLATRHPAVRRHVARAIASVPALDLWLRNRMAANLYAPSALQIDARHLPDEARPLHDTLLARLDIDRTP